ncbi:hypothetical protein B7P43_G11545 [Cryptotermes secundus]|uniref:Sodium channel protein Nach n=1 Tax=Cryptotermes secundus TaxID=105785 RepID=A0A2J7QRU2_9NEOP|nr:hypothetical protein B7P43_G11545 [Cryptotermes secundus]
MKTRNIRKTYELLKTSWTYQTQEYFNNSTLHGVQYIREEGRPFYEKFMWFCFTSVGGVVSLIIIASLWEKFQTNPTITGLDTDFHNWDVPFPTVSLCPNDPVNNTAITEYIEQTWPNAPGERKSVYKEFITELANNCYNNLKQFLMFEGNKAGNLPSVNYHDIIEKVVIKCEKYFSKCYFKGEAVDCCEIFKPLLTEVGFCLSFNSMYAGGTKGKNSSGMKFKLEHIYETDSKWSLRMLIENGDMKDNTLKPVRVYLHSAEDIPITDVSPQHVWDRKIKKIAFDSKQTYTTEGARQLSIKQRKCVFEDEIKLLTSDTYTYHSCMIQCRMKIARDLCKCVPFFYQIIEVVLNVVSSLSFHLYRKCHYMILIFSDGFNSCDLQGLQCLGKHKDEIRLIKCPCELGCSNTVYEVDKLVGEENTDMTKYLEVAFVSWPMVRYKREVLFGWVDLLGKYV